MMTPQQTYRQTAKYRQAVKNKIRRYCLNESYMQEQARYARERRQTIQFQTWYEEYRQRPEVLARKRIAQSRWSRTTRGKWYNFHFSHTMKNKVKLTYRDDCLWCSKPYEFVVLGTYLNKHKEGNK